MESTETARPLTFEDPTKVEATVATLPAPTVAPVGVTTDSPNDHGLTALVSALQAREFALIDSTIVKESAVELVAAVRGWFQDLHFEDLREDTAGAARSLLGRFDLSALTSTVGGAARGLTAARPPRAPAPDAAMPTHVRKIRVTPTVSAKPAAPRAPRRLGGRVRWRRVVTRGLLAGVLAATLISLPPEQYENVANQVGPVIANVANQVGPAIGNIANEVGPAIGKAANDVTSAIGEKLAAAQAAPTLARASFEVPPLSAYGATFEAQAPNPTARPNATVEWVVALRNTGSAGWYRGIDGAQASLALADGTMAGVQTTEYVGPGQVGWFIVHFPAPSQPGVSKIGLRPRIDGRGSLPDLGIYATVTVSPNP
ncbi:MAG: hypothetical protein AABM32_04925 [Chloroflexota bacterium]